MNSNPQVSTPGDNYHRTGPLILTLTINLTLTVTLT